MTERNRRSKRGPAQLALLALTFASLGCQTTYPPLAPETKSKLASVSLDPSVPIEFHYEGGKVMTGLMFGIVGGAVGRAAESSEADEMVRLMADQGASLPGKWLEEFARAACNTGRL